MTGEVVHLPMGTHSHRTSAERAAEELEVLRMKVLGKRDVDIAGELRMSVPTVRKRLRGAIEQHGETSASEYREMLAQRFDFLWRGVVAVIEQDPTNLEAYGKAAAIADRFAKLMGADAPVQVQMEVTQVTEQEKELRDMLAQAGRDEKARETVIIEGEAVDA